MSFSPDEDFLVSGKVEQEISFYLVHDKNRNGSHIQIINTIIIDQLNYLGYQFQSI